MIEKKLLKKRLSQNFLIDENIIKNILNHLNIKHEDIILEIGAGDGSLSKFISKLSKECHLIEIDKIFINKLKDITKINNTYIYNDDILKFNMKDFIKKYKKIRIIGNLPYKISTKIMLNLITFKKNIKDMHFVVQKEIAEKIILEHNNKKYGKLSIILQNFFHIKKIFDIKSSSFYPKPKVTSSFISLTPKKENLDIKDLNIFKNFLTNTFNNRRKKIFHSMKDLDENFNINRNSRPENFSIKEFIEMYKKLNKKTEDY